MYKQIAKPGDRILQALKEKNMTQAELAKIANLNTGGLSSWIKGRYEPKQEALYRMGKALDVSEMWLAGYDVPKSREDRSIEGIAAQIRFTDALLDETLARALKTQTVQRQFSSSKTLEEPAVLSGRAKLTAEVLDLLGKADEAQIDNVKNYIKFILQNK